MRWLLVLLVPSRLRCWPNPNRQPPKLQWPHIRGVSGMYYRGPTGVTATIRLGNSASMTQGRSAGYVSRVRITVDRSLPPSLGRKRQRRGLPTIVGQWRAIPLSHRVSGRVPRRTGGITIIRD
jgi:hypothetical protein